MLFFYQKINEDSLLISLFIAIILIVLCWYYTKELLYGFALKLALKKKINVFYGAFIFIILALYLKQIPALIFFQQTMILRSIKQLRDKSSFPLLRKFTLLILYRTHILKQYLLANGLAYKNLLEVHVSNKIIFSKGFTATIIDQEKKGFVLSHDDANDDVRKNLSFHKFKNSHSRKTKQILIQIQQEQLSLNIKSSFFIENSCSDKFYMPYPHSKNLHERRKSIRYAPRRQNYYVQVNKQHSGLLIDLSEGGGALFTNHSMKVQQHFTVQIQTKHLKAVTVSQKVTGSGWVYGFKFQFNLWKYDVYALLFNFSQHSPQTATPLPQS